jgi:anti-sigma factor RsiW
MACAESLRVQAYFDGELDAMAALELEQHLTRCAECTALLRDLGGLRTTLRTELPYHRADELLRTRIGKAIAGPPAAFRGFRTGLASGIAGTAIAAGLALFAFLPPATEPLVNDLLNAHMRALIGDHLIDVASSDHHTVRPWFSAHADVSPPVADFPVENFRLVGGRQDYIDGRRASVLVYRHGAHVINVFAWASNGKALPAASTRNGYHTVFWRRGTLDFAAVSDAGGPEMSALRQLLQELPDAAE